MHCTGAHTERRSFLPVYIKTFHYIHHIREGNIPVTSAAGQNMLTPPIALMYTSVKLIPLTVVKHSVVVKKSGLSLSCQFRFL